MLFKGSQRRYASLEGCIEITKAAIGGFGTFSGLGVGLEEFCWGSRTLLCLAWEIYVWRRYT